MTLELLQLGRQRCDSDVIDVELQRQPRHRRNPVVEHPPLARRDRRLDQKAIRGEDAWIRIDCEEHHGSSRTAGGTVARQCAAISARRHTHASGLFAMWSMNR